MRFKSLMIIGGTGFFGKSLLDYLERYNSLNINKVIILSRNANKIKISKKLSAKIKIIKISANILKVKKLPFADYVIYAAILNNYNLDFKAVKNYTSLVKKYHFNSKVLYISSGAVYGVQKNKIKGFKENYFRYHNKINYNFGYKKKYSLIKLKNELLFQKLGINHGIKVSIARCFTIVGKYLPKNSSYVIENFITNILDNKNIKIKSSYKVLRSFMYADDLIRWLLKIVNFSKETCPIYNVGSNDTVYIDKLAKALAIKYGLNVKFENLISDKKIDKYIPNIEKAKKELSLYNNLNSLEAIIKTIKILKNNK